MFRRGKWDLPKGKLDKNEKIEDCAVREVKEETGIKKLSLGKFVGLTYHEYFDVHLNKNVIKETHWFSMKVKGDPKIVPQTEEDIELIIWADKKAVKKCLENSYPNIVEIIKKFSDKYFSS